MLFDLLICHVINICLTKIQALEEVEKNIVTMRTMLSGDGEIEPSADQITQLTLDISNEDVISLLFHKLPILGWDVSN